MPIQTDNCPKCARNYFTLPTVFKHPAGDATQFVVLAAVVCKKCQTAYMPLQLVPNRWVNQPGFKASYMLGTVTRDAGATSARTHKENT